MIVDITIEPTQCRIIFPQPGDKIPKGVKTQMEFESHKDLVIWGENNSTGLIIKAKTEDAYCEFVNFKQ